ncbi:B-cell receptor CD22-like protein [Labeo rohita]|uniref:B-cell receptor CD22-like protein n=1 Tax=Labeo rohita TaxID=84645 RepID=A0A498P0N4_LABRO|nr:B-cell receptor CD22-like protein [Labeo rohita]
MCLDSENRGRVQCFHEYKDTYNITLTNVTEADKHVYYCGFTTNRGTWTGIPGAQLDVTEADKHVYYCGFTTNRGTWTGIPGAQLDVTEADKHVYYCGFTTNRGTWTGIPGAQLDVTDNQTDDLYAKVKAKKPKRSGREKIEKDSGDVEEVQYASVHYFKNKDMNKTEETFEMQHPSDAKRSEDVIYSSVK